MMQFLNEMCRLQMINLKNTTQTVAAKPSRYISTMTEAPDTNGIFEKYSKRNRGRTFKIHFHKGRGTIYQ